MLAIIGAGFSRTGTSSLKRALEILGLGPCYHMSEVFQRPEHVQLWTNATTEEPNWHEPFDGYVSAVDAPTCHFWQQIHGAFPEAKVILSVRDADEWYESFYATVFQVLTNPSSLLPSSRAALEMARDLELKRVFSGRLEDKAHAISIYKAHNERVVATVEPENLLVYNLGDGWKPLCNFLGIEVPKAAFPKSNTRAQFRSRLGLP